MVFDTHEDRSRPGRRDRGIADTLAGVFEDAPVAFAGTRGPDHVVTFANRRFRELVELAGQSAVGRPIAALPGMTGLRDVLDRAREQGQPVSDEARRSVGEGEASWNCAAWPLQENGRPPDGLMIELREAGPADGSVATQRAIAERMLLSALREKDLTEVAEASQARAAFLAEAGRRLATSVDLKATRDTITGLSLHDHASWCIVDVVEAGDSVRRLAIVHSDRAKEPAARRLADRWTPEPDDPFGAPAMLRDPRPLVITDVDAVLARAAHDPVTLQTLRELGIGPLLTVPMLIRGHVGGAITFVSAAGMRPYSDGDVQLARELALRSALALENARLFDEAERLRSDAQSANRAKSEFLAHMSHELRTPLNAIAGYVDLIDLEIHGPVTAPQRADLERIKVSQQHLLMMINDILNFMQAERGSLAYHVVDLPAREILNAAFVLTEPVITAKQLTAKGFDCDAAIVLQADRDRTLQILVNLLTNAVKFTPAGGQVGAACSVTEDAVQFTISDSGLGIPADKRDSVFEPFMQVRSGLTERQGGVGLGLAISRELARAMHGDISLESTPGEGSRFTLSLPRAQAARASS